MIDVEEAGYSFCELESVYQNLYRDICFVRDLSLINFTSLNEEDRVPIRLLFLALLHTLLPRLHHSLSSAPLHPNWHQSNLGSVSMEVVKQQSTL